MERIHGRTVQKIQMNQIATMVWSATQSQTFWRVTVWWAFRSTAVNKASGCDGISVEQFKTRKDDAIKVLHSVCKQIWKTQQSPHDWKRLILIPIPKKGSTKECANHRTIALFSHTSKVMLKIFHARLQRYVNQELPDVQAGFRKGRGTRDQITNICWIIDKAREFQKKNLPLFLRLRYVCVSRSAVPDSLRPHGL